MNEEQSLAFEDSLAFMMKYSKKKFQDDIKDYVFSMVKYVMNKNHLKLLYALSKYKVTSVHELSRTLNITRSRDTISYYLIETQNLKLCSMLTARMQSHNTYMRFWKDYYPKTRHDTRLIIASPLAIESVNKYKSIFESFFDPDELLMIHQRNQAIQRFEKHHFKQIEAEMKAIEEIELITIGACKMCSEVITSHQLESKKAVMLGNSLFCLQCFNEGLQAGTLDSSISTKALSQVRRGTDGGI